MFFRHAETHLVGVVKLQKNDVPLILLDWNGIVHEIKEFAEIAVAYNESQLSAPWISFSPNSVFLKSSDIFFYFEINTNSMSVPPAPPLASQTTKLTGVYLL